MNLQKRVEALAELGHLLRKVANGESEEPTIGAAVERTLRANPWFTASHVLYALGAWGESLREESLRRWLSAYEVGVVRPRTVAVVMAGNLPLVGMHDWLCVLLAGHRAVVKLSSNDAFLLPAVDEVLRRGGDADLFPSCRFADGPLRDFDAVIATGSNNSSRYFDYYFGRYPHIIRHNRGSAGVVEGDETRDELAGLCDDVFLHFGLGCRSVSQIFVPRGYDFAPLVAVARDRYGHFAEHHLFQSTYDYHRALLLMNGVPHVDAGFWLLRETDSLFSPVSVLHYASYDDLRSVAATLATRRESLQCVSCRRPLPDVEGCVALGQAQRPALWDYADGVDTLQFLFNL
ncbi:MAG: aldehyde dehydrogenase [Bacteroidales bacterium]|nr:aldehyde dehydrogenase [Bacteroidales bacterium]